MAQDQFEEYDDSDFTQTAGGVWIRILGIVAYMVVIVAYAYQTLELVNWLFPSSNWFMMIVTVFVCDGCATGYAMAEMFYRFRLRRSKHFVFGMWVVTFSLSTGATIIQMYLSSTGNIPHSIDPRVISIAYGLIIAAFVVNIVAITLIIRAEHGAGKPRQRYLDDKPKRPLTLDRQLAEYKQAHPTGTSVQEIPQGKNEHTFTRAQLDEGLSKAYDQGFHHANGKASTDVQEAPIDSNWQKFVSFFGEKSNGKK